jgi:predicted alpha-1,2-mannosidase
MPPVDMKPLSRSRRRLILAAGIASGGVWPGLGTGAPRAASADTGVAWTEFVNPFVGTDGTGHTFPGAVVPFGMVAPSPDNADRGWDYTSGYQFRNPRILGFSNTHISGAGIPELGDVLLMPRQGQAWQSQTRHFGCLKSARSEAAEPGYYTVELPAHQVRVELTASQRVALHRYTFERPGRVQVLVDIQHGLHFNEPHRVQQASSELNTDAGELTGTVHSVAWVERQTSFIVRFDRPVVHVTKLPMPQGHKAQRYVLSFEVDASRQLEARVALSTVDESGARRNLEECSGLDFDAVRWQAKQAWQDVLGRIEIEAPIRQKKIFYTALYHALIHPSDIADRDGRVRGPRGQVIQTESGHYYSTFSLWDTFRAVHPLFTLIVPERVDGMVQSMLEHHAQQGFLPIWTAWGRETYCMIGNPALPVMADAVAKGFHGFDHQEALRAMIETSTQPRPHAPEWAQRGWELLERYGYLPFDLEPHGEAVSKTLELGYGDDAVAWVAQSLGQTETAHHFAKRAQGYRHQWDANTRVMRGRDSQGRWREPFNPDTPTSPLNNPGDYTEANAWQYSLTPALHDPMGLRALMGGPQGMERWLDGYFSRRGQTNKHLGQEAMIGQNAHGNEPSHHAAWLYACTPSPWKGHALIERIARTFYRDAPNGLIGNDDCGQMSAWLVFATLGLYPLTPGQGQYVLGLPMVRQARLNLPTGTLTLRVQTPASFTRQRAHQVQMKMDAQVLDSSMFISHAALLKSQTLDFQVVTIS